MEDKLLCETSTLLLSVDIVNQLCESNVLSNFREERFNYNANWLSRMTFPGFDRCDSWTTGLGLIGRRPHVR